VQLARVPDLVRSRRQARRDAAAFRRDTGLPAPRMRVRTPLHSRGEPTRLCATVGLDLDSVQLVAREFGDTVNGVLHALLATALRAELLARGGSVTTPAVAIFGVSADVHAHRRWGNDVAMTQVRLHIEEPDPLRRARETAASCRQAVRLRRAIGFDAPRKASAYTARLNGRLLVPLARRLPVVANTISTANVPGPTRTRWFGNVPVVDWMSVPTLAAPIGAGFAAHSYAGRLSCSVVCMPDAVPDPAALLARLQPALDELLERVTPGPAARAAARH
jgi:hypothetical protein